MSADSRRRLRFRVQRANRLGEISPRLQGAARKRFMVLARVKGEQATCPDFLRPKWQIEQGSRVRSPHG